MDFRLWDFKAAAFSAPIIKGLLSARSIFKILPDFFFFLKLETVSKDFPAIIQSLRQ